MQVGLEGKVVIVTGAASGIGAAIAAQAAASGATLLLTDRDGPGCRARAAELQALGAPVATLIADLLDAGSPDAIARQALESFGRIDGRPASPTGPISPTPRSRSRTGSSRSTRAHRSS
jgi:NAD(P)-dependent dehydrogenase (short-subunit alcohol dehydrogenase family)